MKVFLSYPREHEDDAAYLTTALRNHGFDVFLDQESITPGQDWDVAIQENIANSHIFVILFDPSAAEEHRYFSIEIREIEERLPERKTLGRVLLYGEDAAEALPPKLARFHATQVTGPREGWAGRVTKASVDFRRSRRNKMAQYVGLAAAVVTIVALGVFLLRSGEQSGIVRETSKECVKLISGLGSGGLTSFAGESKQESKQLWLVGQSLNEVLLQEMSMLRDELASQKGFKLRLLVMSDSISDGNLLIQNMADWEGKNPRIYELAHEELRTLLVVASDRELSIEARSLPLVPFSMVVRDWESEAGAIQFMPKLYRVSGGSLPIFQLDKECDTVAFQEIMVSLEEAWKNATPIGVP